MPNILGLDILFALVTEFLCNAQIFFNFGMQEIEVLPNKVDRTQSTPKLKKKQKTKKS